MRGAQETARLQLLWCVWEKNSLRWTAQHSLSSSLLGDKRGPQRQQDLGDRDMHIQEEKPYKVQRSPEGKPVPPLSECSYRCLPRCRHLRAGAAAKTPPAAVCGPGRVTVVSWAVRGASRVRAAARRWRGPTAESRQAAARRGGLSSPSGREIKGWRVGGGQ